ncbi:MAG: NfeD family protein [Paludibacter sp.]|jgi:membrane-bound ClpP family serine protease|nr:NfeD family protein [Paludibacter sp.]
MDITIVIILLIVGVIFFIVELFLIPGISVAGIAGTLFMGGAVYYAYTHISSTAGHLSLVGSILLLGIAIWIFLRSKALDRFSLKAEITGKNDPLESVVIHIGDKGISQSRLAPMGKVKVNGFIVEAKTNDDFIDPGVEVVVLDIFKTNILVERIIKI